jgi:hypothetical protein
MAKSAIGGDAGEGPDPERKPRRARTFNLAALHEDDFEELVHQLVRVEFPAAEKLDRPDGGADTLLPAASAEGYERCWQAKRHTGRIRWDECVSSLEAALAHWPGLRQVTFCFPQNLNAPKRKTFEARLVKPYRDRVRVDHWCKSELVHRLLEERAARIANHYFKLDQESEAALRRAALAGGILDTTSDAIDRTRTIGSFMAVRDPFFAYAISTHQTEKPGPPLTPGAAIRLTFHNESGSVSIDASPSTPDAVARYGPAGKLHFAEDEVGRSAEERFRHALQHGEAVEIDAGVALEFERLPPALEEFKPPGPISGRVRVIPGQAPAPWPARLTITNGEKSIDADLEMYPEAAPAGWAASWRADLGPLQLTMLLRPADVGIEGSLHWQYQERGGDTVAARLKGIEFLNALRTEGELRLEDRTGARPPLRHTLNDMHAPDWLEGTHNLLTALDQIERWSRHSVTLPDRGFELDELHAIAQAVQVIEVGAFTTESFNATLTVAPEALGELETSTVEIGADWYLHIFDEEVFMGTVRSQFEGIRVIAVEAAGSSPATPAHVQISPLKTPTRFTITPP